MDGAITGFAIAFLTIVLNHLFQSRRDKGQRIDQQKRTSLENVVRSCQQVLNDTSRFAQAGRLKNYDEMQAINKIMHEHGTAITRVKADALLVFDKDLREMALSFLVDAGNTRALVSMTQGQDPVIDIAIEELNNSFGNVCDRARALLFK